MDSIEYIGISRASQEVIARIQRIAPTSLPVHITGETGTGKEVVARLLHHYGTAQGPFTAIDCAALSPTIVESELFGHVRSAFTGASEIDRASSQWPRWQRVLDEVADLPLTTQTRLLRVLERPIGPLAQSTSIMHGHDSSPHPGNPYLQGFKTGLFARFIPSPAVVEIRSTP